MLPWTEITTDLLNLNNKQYLSVVVCLTNYAEVAQVIIPLLTPCILYSFISY